MRGRVVLHGGAEFTPPCREGDAAVLSAAGPGPVVVCALAAPPGAAYDRTGADGVRHLGSLGAQDVVAAPDPRADPAAVERLAAARVLVLPGGSPQRLLEALRATGADDAVRAVLDGGGTVLGCSAGAMVLCASTVLPEGGRPRVAPGLGVVPSDVVAAVLPHWSGPRPDWERLLSDVDGELAGVPERAALVVDGDGTAALGAPVSLLRSGRAVVPGAAPTG